MWGTTLPRMMLAMFVLSGIIIKMDTLNRDLFDPALKATVLRSCPHVLVNTGKCAPAIFIVGAMKCGTNDAMKVLALHQKARFQLCLERPCEPAKHQAAYNNKTGHYSVWESKHLPLDENLDAIANRLPDTDGFTNVTFDKSPMYMEINRFPELPAQLRKMMPQTKVVFAVCDPAERLFAEFNHLLKVNFPYMSPTHRTPEQFSEFMRFITESPDHCDGEVEGCQDTGMYLKKGEYFESIKKWMDVYPLSDLLVLDMKDPRKAEKLLKFANLSTENYRWRDAFLEPTNRNTDYAGRESAWTEYPREMKLLSSYYSESNQNLANLLNESFPLEWRSTVVGS